MAGGLGFEPRLAESESAVLPLDDPPSDFRPEIVAEHRRGLHRPAGQQALRPDQRLEYCGPRRALRLPTFLRSTSRASRVTKPAWRRGWRRVASYFISARAIPWRIAPAWPVMPPPLTCTLMSNFPVSCTSSSG